MEKERFARGKGKVIIGTIGHVDHRKTDLAAAIEKYLNGTSSKLPTTQSAELQPPTLDELQTLDPNMASFNSSSVDVQEASKAISGESMESKFGGMIEVPTASKPFVMQPKNK